MNTEEKREDNKIPKEEEENMLSLRDEEKEPSGLKTYINDDFTKNKDSSSSNEENNIIIPKTIKIKIKKYEGDNIIRELEKLKEEIRILKKEIQIYKILLERHPELLMEFNSIKKEIELKEKENKSSKDNDC